MRSRVERLQEKIEDLHLDAYICRNTSDIRWITSFSNVFDSEDAHMALIIRGVDEVFIHTDSRYSAAMRSRVAECLGNNRADLAIDDLVRADLVIDDSKQTHAKFAAQKIFEAVQLSSGSSKLRIGIEQDIRLNEYRAICESLDEQKISYEIVTITDPIALLREIKDFAEIETLKKAQKITDNAFADLVGWVSEGMTELEVANELEYKMKVLGATGIAFTTIAASGPQHSAMPHAVASERRLQKGDFLVLDFGAKFDDYCSDMTRTIAIGEPSDELKRIYEATLEAHELAKSKIDVGMTGSQIHNFAEESIAKAGYEGTFIHSLGHGVGIDIHESPNLSPKNKCELVAGNVVTVEPGIYIPGIGGVRIEDYGVVTENGFESFTQSPHDLIVIK